MKILRLDTMATALVKVGDSLEELEIHRETIAAYSRGDYDPPDIILQGTLAQLSQMRRLRRLHVPWAFVIGSDSYFTTGHIGPALPHNLEHLTLAEGFIDTDESDDRDEDMISSFTVELESGVMSHLRDLQSVCLPWSCYRRGISDTVREKRDRLGARFNLVLTNESGPSA
ncbi:hypothetical protein FZEAL_2060 [Fusarium zealandicum]|uniref:Uncharacterized protein n=1 Tax=Fusarium zealandicum TaxID=1053134 RepID=A0A8H4XP97_9HYPO|nr:hypothetical protein FZEAL_2060 [Fusarium zealandicum]